jgi:hypothetical protein
VAISREELLLSLQRQKRALSDSIILTPTDSIPFALADREHTAFLHGLYISDKVRDRQTQRDAIVQFAGRGAAARDIAAIHRLFADALGAAEGSLRLLRLTNNAFASIDLRPWHSSSKSNLTSSLLTAARGLDTRTSRLLASSKGLRLCSTPRSISRRS